MTLAYLRAALAAVALSCAAVPAAAQEVRPGGAMSPSQRQDRIEELERELREATDRNDRLQHQLTQTQAEVRRLQGMVSELAAVRDARDEIAAQSAPPPTASGTLGGARPQSAAPPAPPPTPAEDPGAVYGRARELLINGQIRQAEQGFADFLETYSDDEHTSEARYWHSFTLLARDAHGEAAAGFVEYLRQWPRGERAPDSLVRLGIALKGMGRTQQACQAFADLPRRYPRATQGLRDLAARERRGLSCG